MPLTIINKNDQGNLSLVNNNTGGRISFFNQGVIPTPPISVTPSVTITPSIGPVPISGSVYTLIDTIIPYLRANSGSLRNPNFYTYFLDGNAYQILDGGNDMFDNGNYTAPWLRSNISYVNAQTIPIPAPALNYSSQSATLTDTNFYYASFGYTQSFDGLPQRLQSSIYHPLTLIGARSGSGPIGFQKAGNIGADGAGFLISGSIYSGSVVNGFTTYATYRQTYGQSADPTICDVYVLLGHPNWGSVFNTVVSSSAAGTQIQGAALYATGSSSEILAMTTLLSRTSSLAISFNDVKNVVDNYIELVRTVLGYPIPPIATPSLTPSITVSTSFVPIISVTPSISSTPSISLTPSISVTPSISRTISITPSITPSISFTPSITPSAANNIVTDSLFMELQASDYTSGTWNDRTANGNNATINGATWTSTDGGIFDLDGVNDTIQIAHTANLSLNTTTQRTIQVWVKFDALPALNAQIPVFGKLSSASGFDGYWGGLFSNTGNTRVVTNGTAVQRITTSTTNPVAIDTWYLYTFISQITATSNTTKVYINTTEVSTTAHGSDDYSESNPLYLGYIGDGVSSPYLNGKIGACYFYTKGLSLAEITTNFNVTKAKYGL